MMGKSMGNWGNPLIANGKITRKSWTTIWKNMKKTWEHHGNIIGPQWEHPMGFYWVNRGGNPWWGCCLLEISGLAESSPMSNIKWRRFHHNAGQGQNMPKSITRIFRKKYWVQKLQAEVQKVLNIVEQLMYLCFEDCSVYELNYEGLQRNREGTSILISIMFLWQWQSVIVCGSKQQGNRVSWMLRHGQSWISCDKTYHFFVKTSPFSAKSSCTKVPSLVGLPFYTVNSSYGVC